MQKILMKKEKQFEKEEDLVWGDNYGEVIKITKQQNKILEDCKKFYTLMRLKDEEQDEFQSKAGNRGMNTQRGRKKTNRKNTFSFDDIKTERTGSNAVKQPLSKEEEGFLNRWDAYSKEMDETLEEVFDQMGIMLEKLDDIDKAQDENINLANDLADQIDGVHQDMKFNNQQLKKILTELRKPGKICADISMALTLSMLIGVLVYVIKLYMSLEE